ncbi:MAG: anti-sigma factor, partial [Jiangellaceae bacterium]
ACAILLPMAEPEATLECRFELRTDHLDVIVSVPAPTGELPGRDTFAWTVLSALAGDVDASAADGRVTIELRKKRV